MEDAKEVAKFLFEVGILSKTPRSGFHFLGSGQQSVSEHILRVIYTGYSLAQLAGDVNITKVLKMCLFHDLAEGRVSDLNYVHQKYVEKKEQKAIDDLTKPLPFGDDIKEILKEYETRESKESLIAKDADNIEWILSLKEQFDNGNIKAKEWIDNALKRLKTEVAQNLAKEILDSSSDDWWFGDKKDDWWVNRNKDG